jgi:hypothetical protein
MQQPIVKKKMIGFIENEDSPDPHAGLDRFPIGGPPFSNSRAAATCTPYHIFTI